MLEWIMEAWCQKELYQAFCEVLNPQADTWEQETASSLKPKSTTLNTNLIITLKNLT